MTKKPNRMPPWKYPKKVLPRYDTLGRWRTIARRLARERGARTACDLCKRPLHHYGQLRIRHPRSRGRSRNRTVCAPCATILIHLVDILEWSGACDHLPTEHWEEFPIPSMEDGYGISTHEPLPDGLKQKMGDKK